MEIIQQFIDWLKELYITISEFIAGFEVVEWGFEKAE